MNNDLISREALIQHAYSAIVDGVEKDIIDLSDVDNAPSASPKEICIANIHFDEEKLKEIVHTEVIDKIESGELVLKAEMPQGEWEKIGEIGLAYKCNRCGEVDVIPTNFCPNCGAKMQEGGAE